MRIQFLFVGCVVLALAAGVFAQAAPAPDTPNPEYLAKIKALDAKQAAARVHLGLWCAERNFFDEALGQLQAAALVTPPDKDSIEAWRTLADKMPVSDVDATVALKGGSVIKGACASAPLVVVQRDNLRFVPLDRIKRLSMVKPVESGSTLKFETAAAPPFEGVPLVASLSFRTNLGEFNIPVQNIVSLTVDGVHAKEAFKGPLNEMRCCFETLSRVGNTYATYGAADYYSGVRPDEKDRADALVARDLARKAVESNRDKYPRLQAREPAEYSRFVMLNDTEVVGEVRARNAETVSIDVLTPDGFESRQLPVPSIKTSEPVKVAAADINAARQKQLCKDLVAAAQAQNRIAALAVWGKLRCEFPEGDWAPEADKALKDSKAVPGTSALLEQAVAWAGTTCPACLGIKTAPCKECSGKGRLIKSGPKCTACDGKGAVPCDRCKGSGQWTFLVAAPVASGAAPSPSRSPWYEESRGRAKTVAREECDERLELALWCGANGLFKEAEAQLRLATASDPGNEHIVPAWVAYIGKAPWKTVVITLVLDDDTIVKGACSLAPILIRHDAEILVIPFEDMFSFTLVDRTPAGVTVKIVTHQGPVQGLLVSPPMSVKTSIGNVKFTLDKIKQYSFETPDTP